MDEMIDDQYCLNYLKELLKTLSCEDPVQQHRIPREVMWNLPSDIACEWEYESIEFFIRILADDHVISRDMEEKSHEICDHFEKASAKGTQYYDPMIWTIEGFVKHPFWKNQRKSARQLLDALEKIQL